MVGLALIRGSFSLVHVRAVTDSINQLITMCTQQAPGQKECDNALRELEVRSCILLREWRGWNLGEGEPASYCKGQEGAKRRGTWRSRTLPLDVTLVFLQTVKELLENPTQTVNDMSYFNCLDSVMENSKVSPEPEVEVWGRIRKVWESRGGKGKGDSSPVGEAQ